MEREEVLATRRLQAVTQQINVEVSRLGGRVFNTAGDAFLAEFPSVLDAVRCAAELRNKLAGGNSFDGESIHMRFGLHLADVVVHGNDLIGDGVNWAARIQQAAQPDEILLSASMFEHIRRNSPFNFDRLGERNFKNISEPMEVYRLRGEKGNHRMQVAPTQTQPSKGRRPASVAVLPFRVTPGDEDQCYLANGITDELIVELGRFRQLFVTSRSASFALAEGPLDPVKVGDLLGVEHVLEGQIRRIGDRLRIGITLSETQSGTVLWSDKITRPFDELIDLLDEVTAKIAATVSGRVQEAAMVATRRKRSENMNAMECLLRGIDHHRLGGVTDDHVIEAVNWFNKAIDIDPNFGPAYAWRVCSASGLPNFDVAQGERDTRRAMELDPMDAESHRILATFELWKDNHEQAVARIRRAMELNPTDAYLKARSASISTYNGDFAYSLELLDQAENLDPFLPVWCVEERGIALYAMGSHIQALVAFEKLAFQTFRSRLYRAASLVALNRMEEARRLVLEAMASKPNLSVASFLQSERYRDLDCRRLLGDRLQSAGLSV
jgi:TolB-like protein